MSDRHSKSMSEIWFTVTVLVLLASTAYAGIYSGGTGTASDPYQIGTTADWSTLSATPTDWDKYFVLIADIDFGGSSLIPLGSRSNAFRGVFEGNRHVLSNGKIELVDSEDVGIFGYVGYTGKILDVGVEYMTVIGSISVGGLAGRNEGAIDSCYAFGTTSGDSSVGGLAGFSTGTISSCYAAGSTTGRVAVGGLVGQISRTGSVLNSYARSAVYGSSSVGGLTGQNWGTITACYATGSTASATIPVGGLTSYNGDTITSSYWDMETTGLSTSAGGEDRTTVEMTHPYASNTYTGWDFTSVWAADTEYNMNDGYPYLRSMVRPDDNACGCCRTVAKNMSFKELVRKAFGDWLLVGLSLGALAVFSVARR